MSTPCQDDAAAAKNREFFGRNHGRYAKRMQRLQTTRNTRALVSREVAGAERAIDVGNGGVFEYDPALVGEIVAVDLFVDDHDDLPPNVSARLGSALDLPADDESFDVAIFSMLLHHLVGRDANAVAANAQTAIREAVRVLKPGGRLVVAESCVPAWFYHFEQYAYRALSRLSKTRLMSHPPTLQLTPALIASMMTSDLDAVRSRRIPVGHIVLQFGVPWPVVMTPARPWLFVGTKRTRAR